MPTKRKPQQKRRLTSPVRHKRPGLLVRLIQRMPGWAWWIGSALIVALYVFFFYYIFVGPFGFRWRALYGDVNYPEGYEIHGIDISHHQGTIDWQELKDNGQIDKYPVRFIYMKATEGASIVDENFYDNFHQAREYGFTRGAYHFYSVHSPAKAQAEYFIRLYHFLYAVFFVSSVLIVCLTLRLFLLRPETTSFFQIFSSILAQSLAYG